MASLLNASLDYLAMLFLPYGIFKAWNIVLEPNPAFNFTVLSLPAVFFSLHDAVCSAGFIKHSGWLRKALIVVFIKGIRVTKTESKHAWHWKSWKKKEEKKKKFLTTVCLHYVCRFLLRNIKRWGNNIHTVNVSTSANLLTSNDLYIQHWLRKSSHACRNEINGIQIHFPHFTTSFNNLLLKDTSGHFGTKYSTFFLQIVSILLFESFHLLDCSDCRSKRDRQ